MNRLLLGLTLLASMSSYAAKEQQVQEKDAPLGAKHWISNIPANQQKSQSQKFEFDGLKTVSFKSLASAISQNIQYMGVEILDIKKSENLIDKGLSHLFDVQYYSINYKVDGKSVITSTIREWTGMGQLQFMTCESDNGEVVLLKNVPLPGPGSFICFAIEAKDIDTRVDFL